MELATEKWGGIPHYRGEIHVLGEDASGLWCWGESGRAVYWGDAVHHVTDTLILVPPRCWWTISWYPGHERAEFYVNICTPPVREIDRIISIDTDLDVVGWLDGTVEIVDRDEFELHQTLCGYARDIIEATERAADEAFALASARTPPFDGSAAAVWAERARRWFAAERS